MPAGERPARDYREKHRPQIHFSPEKMWMNDPNGLVWYAGEYHLFYQYYPNDVVWGPMHWGHAVSRDLLHWQHLPIALFPDSLGYIFSGSAVVDYANTSGFKTGPEAPIVAMFTYHDPVKGKAGTKNHEYQGIAFSNDRGRSWTKYAGNPVIPNPGGLQDFRDPKVFWHEPTRHWIVALARGDRAAFYRSPDLKNWTPASEFGVGYGSPGLPWECPDLFELPVEGTSETRWVLLVSLPNSAPNGGSGTQYFIGTFDGTTFVPENTPATTLWIDHGKDNYAGVTWSNAPGGRRLFLGWMSNWQYAQQVPTAPWRSAMTLPRELRLQKTAAGIRLFQRPAPEVVSLRKGPGKNIRFSGNGAETPVAQSLPCLIELDWELPAPGQALQAFGIQLQNGLGEKVDIGYDPQRREVFVDRSQAGPAAFSEHFAGRHTAPYTPTGKRLSMRLVVDVSSVELFVDDGALALAETFFPTEDFRALQLFYQPNARPVSMRGQVASLRSVWR